MPVNNYETEKIVYNSCFLTFDDPHCIWDTDIKRRNTEYLNTIDPFYFEYAAGVHEPYLNMDDERVHYAALAIRTTYSHALETMFALIGAALQAPDAPVGWMMTYQNKNLSDLIRSVHNRRPHKILWVLDKNDWDGVAELLIPINDVGKQKKFAKLWRRLATDFLDTKRENEYNSIKHGLRANPSDYFLAFGAETTPGVPASAEAMRMISKSPFGSSYYSVEVVQQKPNFQVRNQRLNWHPQNMLAAISIMCFAIGNIVSFLKRYNGTTLSNLRAYYPQDETAFDAPWQHSVGITSASFDRQVVPQSITPLTREQIKTACLTLSDTEQTAATLSTPETDQSSVEPGVTI